MHSSEIAVRMRELEMQISPLQHELVKVAKQYRDALSREWIAANNVRREDVSSPDDFSEWFGVIGSFIRVIPECKRWAEWNGRLYSVAELKAGYMDPDAPGFMEHVQ